MFAWQRLQGMGVGDAEQAMPAASTDRGRWTSLGGGSFLNRLLPVRLCSCVNSSVPSL